MKIYKIKNDNFSFKKDFVTDFLFLAIHRILFANIYKTTIFLDFCLFSDKYYFIKQKCITP